MEYDLVFEGGGAKGVAFVGALQAFERHGHVTRRVIGTSAGSITACLIAAEDISGNHISAADQQPEGLHTDIGQGRDRIVSVDGALDAFDQGNVGSYHRKDVGQF